MVEQEIKWPKEEIVKLCGCVEHGVSVLRKTLWKRSRRICLKGRKGKCFFDKRLMYSLNRLAYDGGQL